MNPGNILGIPFRGDKHISPGMYRALWRAGGTGAVEPESDVIPCCWGGFDIGRGPFVFLLERNP